MEINMDSCCNVNNINNKRKAIFISHSSKDVRYVAAIVNLLEEIGLKETQIFCSSFPEYGIPLGENIFNYLKSQFNSLDLTVLFILSDNYYKSEICLNEMGAAWVLKQKVFPIALPEFPIENMKGVISGSKALLLGSDERYLKSELDKLKSYIEDRFSLEKLPSNYWENISQKFCTKIKEISEHIFIGEISSKFTNAKGTFYLLKEKLPFDTIQSENYVLGESHWLADWGDKNKEVFINNSKVKFKVTKVEQLDTYYHNGKRVENARNIYFEIL
jgi:hypothetical protein